MRAGGEPGSCPAPVSARASWAARRAQPGIDSAWASCSSYGASSRSITCGQVIDVGGSRSMREHRGQQGGVLGGEELRALQRFFQLADLAAGRAAGQLGQHLGVAFPGDQVVHDVPAGHPVQAVDPRRP